MMTIRKILNHLESIRPCRKASRAPARVNLQRRAARPRSRCHSVVALRRLHFDDGSQTLAINKHFPPSLLSVMHPSLTDGRIPDCIFRTIIRAKLSRSARTCSEPERKAHEIANGDFRAGYGLIARFYCATDGAQCAADQRELFN